MRNYADRDAERDKIEFSSDYEMDSDDMSSSKDRSGEGYPVWTESYYNNEPQKDDSHDDAAEEFLFTPTFPIPSPENTQTARPRITILSQNLRGMGSGDEQNRKLAHIRATAESTAQHSDVIFLQELQRSEENDPTPVLTSSFCDYDILVGAPEAGKEYDCANLTQLRDTPLVFQEEASTATRTLATIPLLGILLVNLHIILGGDYNVAPFLCDRTTPSHAGTSDPELISSLRYTLGLTDIIDRAHTWDSDSPRVDQLTFRKDFGDGLGPVYVSRLDYFLVDNALMQVPGICADAMMGYRLDIAHFETPEFMKFLDKLFTDRVRLLSADAATVPNPCEAMSAAYIRIHSWCRHTDCWKNIVATRQIGRFHHQYIAASRLKDVRTKQ
ncbi:hypothetical protein IWW50_005215 [Coemansia erecta]|nr:hypothetical protein IWW50_005215 [Coemansia erecta]